MTGSRRRLRRPVAGVVALIVAIAIPAACGGGDDGAAYRQPSGPAQATLRIKAGNFFFKPASLKGPAGVDKVELVGEGGVHTLVIDGVAHLQLRVDGDGDRDSAKVRFAPGSHIFYCDIPGHRDEGMEGTITIS